jgi:hypothetical protein
VTKNNKIAIGIGIGLIIAFFVIRDVVGSNEIRIRRRKRDDDTTEGTPTPEVGGVVTPTPDLGIGETIGFPLKRGSKGAKVKELQRAILSYNIAYLGPLNFIDGDKGKLYTDKGKDDGKFGELTEFHVNSILGKKTIDSQADIDKIKSLPSKNKLRIENAKKFVKEYKKKQYIIFKEDNNAYEKTDKGCRDTPNKTMLKLSKKGDWWDLVGGKAKIDKYGFVKITFNPTEFCNEFLFNPNMLYELTDKQPS